MRRKSRSSKDNNCVGGGGSGGGGGSVFGLVDSFHHPQAPHHYQQQQQQQNIFSMEETTAPPLAPSPSFWSNECEDANEYSPNTPLSIEMDDPYHPRRPRKRPRLKMEDAFRSMSLQNDSKTTESPKPNDILEVPQHLHQHQQQQQQMNVEMGNIKVENNHIILEGNGQTTNMYDMSSDSEPEKDPESRAAKDAMYRLVFGGTTTSTKQKTSAINNNPVDAKIEDIIRKSRMEALMNNQTTTTTTTTTTSINNNSMNNNRNNDGIVTETRDDFHLQTSQKGQYHEQDKKTSQGYGRNRSKSFDDLEAEMIL